jgi:hypothetical protein
MGLSHILFMLISCPQSLQVMEVPPAIFLILMYMPQAHALLVAGAEGIGTATCEPQDFVAPIYMGPLVEARRAHFSGIKGVPLVAAGARPAVILAGRPAAKRASYPRAGGVGAFLLIRLAIQNHGRFGGAIWDGAHATVL